ncbi:hypothetical protein ACF07T_27825 [Streptomyces sp. NPDC015184]|uniref:hypothetical protein n=1 Tax=Streptomyces sp. NPDC015184 TaxID=3364946 RepID=UPI0036FE4F76
MMEKTQCLTRHVGEGPIVRDGAFGVEDCSWRDQAAKDVHGRGGSTPTTDLRLTIADKADPALRLLLSGMPVRLGQAEAQVGSHVRRLTETLIMEELCEPLIAGLSSG